MQNKAGFSMLELMIVIGIIAIMSAIAVPNLIGWYQHQGLRSAVVELQGNLQLAKMSAVKQNLDCSVNINTGAGSYNIPCIGKTVSLGTYSGGVVFDSPDGSTTDNLLTFTSRGLCSPFGSVYLTNRDQSAFYMTQVFISGGVVTSRWNGANWE
jgi:prepilin-type N-terminal cleavage/methylation domain-containing protein